MLDERECEVEVEVGALFLVLLGLAVVVVIEDVDNEGVFVVPAVRVALALEARFWSMGPGPDPGKGAEDAFINSFAFASASSQVLDVPWTLSFPSSSLLRSRPEFFFIHFLRSDASLLPTPVLLCPLGDTLYVPGTLSLFCGRSWRQRRD